ncbi:MAG: DUF4446 family protein [Lachnospiraceae bacterium]|nr:DUF4446 family protein [Lachnospiraceae bacterium]
MQSQILNGLGLGGIDAIYLCIVPMLLEVALLVFLIVLWRKHKALNEKYQKFLRGKDAETLEDDIYQLFEDNDRFREELDISRKDISRIYETLSHSFMKIGLVRYDAFSQMGGKMSFVLALLDESDNGFLLNTVHSTENCYSYVKNVLEGKVEANLSEEEKEALAMALEYER